jgi:hypothetical protein
LRERLRVSCSGLVTCCVEVSLAKEKRGLESKKLVPELLRTCDDVENRPGMLTEYSRLGAARGQGGLTESVRRRTKRWSEL